MSERGNAKIEFVPWDANSVAHYERMIKQREACGFGADFVDVWAKNCKAGTTAMYWITLAQDSPGRDEALRTHTERFPEEAEPLLDTAVNIFKDSRQPPATGASFQPIGHVGLAIAPHRDALLGLPADVSTVWLIGIYTSWAVQRGGIGGKAMRMVEAIAADPKGPVKAQVIALDAIPESLQFNEQYQQAFYHSRGIPLPHISNQRWYEKQGYVEFHYDPNAVTWQGAGEPFIIPLVYFKKPLQSS